MVNSSSEKRTNRRRSDRDRLREVQFHCDGLLRAEERCLVGYFGHVAIAHRILEHVGVAGRTGVLVNEVHVLLIS